jgi:hypothetical protein
MEIIAHASLYYNEAKSMTSGWERLELNVSFKQPGKLLKTYLTETLASTFNYYNSHLVPDKDDRYETLDEYYEDVEWLISDLPAIEREAEKMIREYFDKKSKQFNEDNRKSNLVKKVNKMEKIEVRVSIK